MKRTFLLVTTLGILLGFKTPERKIENTAFNINDYSWLVGHWRGKAFDGTGEEIWASPVNGTMMGMYRNYTDEGPVFYEFMLMDETGLKLKHFNPDITGWETKEKYVHFKMVSYTPDMLTFKGISFEKISDDEIEIRLKLNRGGEITTEVFNKKRVTN